MKKKQQHYVFRAYLKPWTVGDKIFCLRAGKLFESGLMGVAAERFFYETQDLTQEEVEFLRTHVFSKNEPLRSAQEHFISLYLLPHKLLRKAAFQQDADSRFMSVLEELVCNSVEDYHARIEVTLLRFLKAMLQGDVSFYSSEKEVAEFLYSITVQYTRTKHARAAALLRYGEETIKGVSTQRVWPVISELMAMGIGLSLYVQRDRYRLVLVENDSDTPFITGDQPIINIHAKGDDDKPTDKLEFFYPLSPTRATLLVEKETEVPSKVGAITVNNYNVLIAQNSHEQLFSNSEAYLKTFSNVVAADAGERLRT